MPTIQVVIGTTHGKITDPDGQIGINPTGTAPTGKAQIGTTRAGILQIGAVQTGAITNPLGKALTDGKQLAHHLVLQMLQQYKEHQLNNLTNILRSTSS